MRIFEALLLGIMVLSASAGNALGENYESEDVSMLMVSGTGDSTADADMVTIVLGVQTRNESAAGAVADNAQMMAEAVDALQAAGVPEEEIKTSSYYDLPHPRLDRRKTVREGHLRGQ